MIRGFRIGYNPRWLMGLPTLLVCMLMVLTALSITPFSVGNTSHSGLPNTSGAGLPSTNSHLEAFSRTRSAQPILQDTFKAASPRSSIGSIPVGSLPWGVAYDSGNGEVFVTDSNTGNVSVISDATNKVVATIPVGSNPVGVAYDSGKGEVFVTNEYSNSVSVISDGNNTVVVTIPVGSYPWGVAYDSGKGEVFVANFNSGNVNVISDANNTVVTTILVGTSPYGVAYDSGKGEVFVANSYSMSVSVISDVSNTVVATIPVSGSPFDVAYDSGEGGVGVFVTNYNSGNVNVILDANNTVVATIPVGSSPYGVGYDSRKGEVFVANDRSDTVSVIPANLSVAASAINPSGHAWLNVTFTASPSAGSWNYTNWAWSFGDGNTSSLQNPTHTYTKPGTYRANVTVTDSSGAKATSNMVWINVTQPLPFSTTLTPSITTASVGQTVYVNASMSGGVGPFSFKWNATPAYAGCVTSATISVATCTPTLPGKSFSLGVEVTDLYGATDNTTSPSITVSSLSASLSASKTSIFVGQPVVFNISTSGDSATLSYAYTAPPSAGCMASTGRSITCTPQKPGWSFSVNATVTDQYGNTWNATSPVVAVAAGSVSLGVSLTSVDVGQSLQFNATIANIGSTVTYSYHAPVAAGCLASAATSVTCTPQKPGWSFSVNVTVTDQYGNTWNATSPVVSTRVPTVTVLPSRIAVDVNESMTFATSVTGDLATLYYAYTSPTMAGCALSTSATLTCIPKSNGTFAVSVAATDLYGNSWTATSVTIKVYPALMVNLTISSSTPLLAQTVAFTSNASGGNPPYNYTYLGLPHGCYSENKSSIGCLPTQSDWYNITVIVTDMNNGTAKATVSMHVIFDFNVVIPASSPVGKQLTIMVDTNETFNGSAINKSVLFRPDGGYGTLTYSYSGLPPGCTSADVSVLTCTPTQAGRYSVTVSVHDQAGDHQTHTVLVNIVPSSNNSLGLPGYEGYLLIGAIVVAGVVGTTLLVLKKRRSSPPASKGEASKDKELEKKEGGKATDETSPEHEKIAMGEGANSKE